MKLHNIKVICWDFDGTLFQINDRIWSDIFEAQYRIIMRHTGWDYGRAKIEHAKIYKVVTQSSTDAVARICGMSIVDTLMESEEYYDRSKYVTYDPKLVGMFAKLKKFRHLMYVNGKRSREEPVIAKLGLDSSLFETWITPEETGTVKPDPMMANAILVYTKLDSASHLVVGDRELVDLKPAHEFGMKTCLVWSDTAGSIADATVADVYHVPDIVV